MSVWTATPSNGRRAGGVEAFDEGVVVAGRCAGEDERGQGRPRGSRVCGRRQERRVLRSADLAVPEVLLVRLVPDLPGGHLPALTRGERAHHATEVRRVARGDERIGRAVRPCGAPSTTATTLMPRNCAMAVYCSRPASDAGPSGRGRSARAGPSAGTRAPMWLRARPAPGGLGARSDRSG